MIEGVERLFRRVCSRVDGLGRKTISKKKIDNSFRAERLSFFHKIYIENFNYKLKQEFKWVNANVFFFFFWQQCRGEGERERERDNYC